MQCAQSTKYHMHEELATEDRMTTHAFYIGRSLVCSLDRSNDRSLDRSLARSLARIISGGRISNYGYSGELFAGSNFELPS